MQREIVELLHTIAPPGSFAVQRSAPAEALRIDVKGVGALELPLAARTVSRLREVAKPARYGLRDRTVYDTAVRHSREIARSRIRIDQRRWNETLLPLLDEIRAGLGLAEGVTLKAELHNMLLYERGQFFKSHQDSEKTDGMIGTLVVTLPSPFRGGEMSVEQHGEVMAFRGSRSDVQLVAFYADCRHEVRPVTGGARVVLTYNLLAKGVATAMPPQVEPHTLDVLAGALQRHFETPLAGRFGGEAAPPDRLVYLLDHEYTARGLRWHLLKGADAARASALQTVAGRLDCEIFLAQADVHETWQCESDPDDWYPSRRRAWRDSWDDFDGDDDPGDSGGDDVEPILTDLIDSDIELRNWVAAGSKTPAAISSAVRDEELCYTRPSSDMSPFQSEHTGYMGNWGNTLDRWYHRAAIVMWPRERTFIIRARASASWALSEVVQTLQRGNQEDARRKVESLLPFWSHTARFTPEPIIHDALRAAAGVADPILASRLLGPLSLESLDPEAASLFEPLLRQFGPQWCEDVLSALPVAQGDAHGKWLDLLPRIGEELAEAGDAGWSLARWLAVRQWEWVEGELRQADADPSPSDAREVLTILVPPLLNVLRTTLAIGAFDLQESIVRHLATTRTERRVDFLTTLLRAASSDDADLRLALVPLHELCVESLTAWLSAPPREPGDWAILAELSCRCDRCSKLHTFLIARERTVLEWPLAKEHRAHVHQMIERHELPLDHRTRRTGRPYTLVLTKRDALFAQDTARRKRWTEDLAWVADALRRNTAGSRRG
ncbi:MAG TPA: 2OG-Fe(II) oxygenase [Thermoanaerobaculia bacterium]|nr:2OG-Fe(II) oxygenase [Thermoanaerobaculia bacterium]